ncbi:MAG: hypothetical protein BHW37_02730 [Firmicutes bacterium CAG:272_52_7]|nr:MAG: hypothetical protein BHW37_02730 [Firmicutes bacterium CAG:272_52_7]
MTEDLWQWCRCLTEFVKFDICAADTDIIDFDKHLTGTRFRYRTVLDADVFFPIQYSCFHAKILLVTMLKFFGVIFCKGSLLKKQFCKKYSDDYYNIWKKIRLQERNRYGLYL